MKRRTILSLLPVTAAGMVLPGVERSRAMPPVSPPPHSPAHRPGMPVPARLGPGAEPMALQYRNAVRDHLRLIRDTQAENILESAYAIARTVMRGGTCWYSWDMGHHREFDLTPGRNGVPEIVTQGFDPERARDGDLFLASLWGGDAGVLTDTDITVVGCPVPWGQDAALDELIVRDTAKTRLRPVADIWIETYQTTLGAILRIPGSPAPAGPLSGVIGMSLFWMMMADACRILSRGGTSVPVRGDAPPISANAGFSGLNEPLMDHWFDTLMNEMEMIGAELGAVKTAARLAVDSVLAGGRVHCYSRYYEKLPVEGQTRRGGLALTRALHPEDGELVPRDELEDPGRDLVFMGLDKPDDPVDMENLRRFRDMGMTVVSIGPMTRGGSIPDGPTVPKEADVHLGRMTDSYGLYALPGFERRVCPTSGAMLNQLFWSTCMQIIGELHERTGGDTPGIWLSGAIEGGNEHNSRVRSMYRERGY